MMTSPLSHLLAWSGFLRRFEQKNPPVFHQLVKESVHPITNEWTIERYSSLLSEYSAIDTASLGKVLRQLRTEAFIRLMLRDCLYAAPLEEIIQQMSFLADWCIQKTYLHCAQQLAEAHGMPIAQNGFPQEMLIIAMGKLGGNELNVSSDIDLVFLYNEEGETNGRRPLSFQEFYQKLGQRIMLLLSENTADGFVFRTDLRLRPNGDSGPLVWSIPALERYFIEQGREWERYAWLKARAIPVQAFSDSYWNQQVHAYECVRKPFVYRKYLDFDALQELGRLREQIRQDWDRKKSGRLSTIPLDNIKLGEGGIREIEFIVQAEQLIRGGREPHLQQRPLLDALYAQKQSGCIDTSTYDQLYSAYRFLRRVEHLLQYREDEQTHLLPAEEASKNLLATLMIPHSPEQSWETLGMLRQQVQKLFQTTFSISNISPSEVPDQSAAYLEEALLEHVFQQHAPDMIQRWQAFLKSGKIRSLGKKAQGHLHTLIPRLIEVVQETPDPHLAFGRLLEFIESIGKRSGYLSLLVSYPNALLRLARMLAASQWATQYLIQHPILLDELIHVPNSQQPLSEERFQQELHQTLLNARLPNGYPDVELQMDRLREFQQLYIFHVLAQDLNGKLTVEQIGDQLSWLADTLLTHALELAWQTVAKDTSHPPRFAIIGYGKLGGKEMGYESDLDLVFLYDDTDEDAQEIYSRLARKLCSWLQSLTPSGRLYSLDLRLRPDGDAGLLVQTMEGFVYYQTHKAWTWEHQALTRARYIAGDPTLQVAFDNFKLQLLTQTRDPVLLARDILTMRTKMLAHKKHSMPSDIFDIKADSGGMIDVEFVTQFLVLLYAKDHPILCKNLGNIALLSYAAQTGLTSFSSTLAAVEAYRLLRRKQHQLRLQNVSQSMLPITEVLPAVQAVQQLWHEVFDAFQSPESNPSHNI